MKSLLSALVITAASVFPVSASLHDFNPTNAAPVPSRNKAQVGQGECLTTRNQSKMCYIKTSASNFSISILDVDYLMHLKLLTLTAVQDVGVRSVIFLRLPLKFTSMTSARLLADHYCPLSWAFFICVIHISNYGLTPRPCRPSWHTRIRRDLPRTP